MKLFSFLLMCCFGLSLSAQITIDSGDFPDGGDTTLVSVSTDFGLDFTSTGVDYEWNFEALTMSQQRIDTFFNISSASIIYQLVFNNGLFEPDYQSDYYTNLVNFTIPSTDIIGITIDKPVGFTKVESDFVEIVGVGLEISGIQVPVKNDTIDVEYELPFTYENNWISNSYFEIDLNPAFDGILRRYQERSSEVDGWGMVTTPFGTFEAVRTKSVLNFTDSVRVSFGGGDPTWFELPTPTQIVYSWWAKDQKIPVLQVVSQDVAGSETVSSVEYKDRYLGDVSVAEADNLNLLIYPNPASNWVQISSAEPIQSIEILTIDGRLVQNYSWNAATKQLDVTNLAKGNYFVKIQVESGSVTEQLIVQ